LGGQFVRKGRRAVVINSPDPVNVIDGGLSRGVVVLDYVGRDGAQRPPSPIGALFAFDPEAVSLEEYPANAAPPWCWTEPER